MAAIDDVNFGGGDVAAIGFGLGRIEGQFVLAPDNEEARLFLAHPCWPFGVGVDVGAIVVEDVALNRGLTGLSEKIKFIGPEIRIIALDVGIAAEMASAGCRQR